MLATEPPMAIGWDEGYTLGREERLRDWFRALRDPARFAAELAARGRSTTSSSSRRAGRPPPGRDQLDSRSKLLFDRDVSAWFWPFAREEPHGHPPFYALARLDGRCPGPVLAGAAASATGADPALQPRRRGDLPVRRRRDGASGRPASPRVAWVLQPNLFGHGHYAAYDGVLSSLWALAIIVFAQAVAPCRPGADSSDSMARDRGLRRWSSAAPPQPS